MSRLVMAAISLWQPWASLWLSENKVNETRHWSTKHRGWLIVHAAKRRLDALEQDDPLRAILVNEYGPNFAAVLPFGAIIGAVDLTGCHLMRAYAPEHHRDMVCGNWSDERFGWRRGRYVSLPTPIPYRGSQGKFNVSTDVIQSLMDLIPAEDER